MNKITQLTLLVLICSGLACATPSKFADMTIRQVFAGKKGFLIGAAIAVPSTIVAFKAYQSRQADAQLHRAIRQIHADRYDREVEKIQNNIRQWLRNR